MHSRAGESTAFATKAHSKRAHPEVPQEDKEFLSSIGFDVTKYLGSGLFGHVFSGLCNSNSQTGVEITENEFDENDNLNWFDQTRQSYVKMVTLNGDPCAIKWIHGRIKWTNQDYNEARLLKELNHPNIVKVYEVCKVKSNIYLIMEFMKGGTLKAFIEALALDEKLDQFSTSQIVKQTTAGLQYLHHKGVVHCDLHGKNIMLTTEKAQLRCKIVDFGNAKEIGKNDPKIDINSLYYNIRQIIEKTLFSDKRIEDGLTRLMDMMSLGVYDSMQDVANQVNTILPDEPLGTPPPRRSAISKFTKWFKK